MFLPLVHSLDAVPQYPRIPRPPSLCNLERVAVLLYGTPGAGVATAVRRVSELLPGAFALSHADTLPPQITAPRLLLWGLHTAHAIQATEKQLLHAGYTPVRLRVDDPSWHATCTTATGARAQRWLHPHSLSVLLPRPHMRLVNDKTVPLDGALLDLLVLALPLVVASVRAAPAAV